jgi:hypothetical protein
MGPSRAFSAQCRGGDSAWSLPGQVRSRSRRQSRAECRSSREPIRLSEPTVRSPLYLPLARVRQSREARRNLLVDFFHFDPDSGQCDKDGGIHCPEEPMHDVAVCPAHDHADGHDQDLHYDAYEKQSFKEVPRQVLPGLQSLRIEMRRPCLVFRFFYILAKPREFPIDERDLIASLS